MPLEQIGETRRGYCIFVEQTEQGRAYWSDEVGGGVCIWHTALADTESLLVAMLAEHRERALDLERLHAERRKEQETARAILRIVGELAEKIAILEEGGA